MKQGRETTLDERIQIVRDCNACGKNYLSAILDLCDRRIVSFVMNGNPLVYKTFDKANAHPLFHSDRGFSVHEQNVSSQAGKGGDDPEHVPCGITAGVLPESRISSR